MITRARHLSSSYRVWLGLMAYLVVVKLSVTAFPVAFKDPSQLQVFQWRALAIWAALGFVGIWCSLRTGFPEAWDDRLSLARKLWLPIALGLTYAGIEIAFDLATHYTAWESAQHGGMQANIAFPASALIYPGGAIIVEVVYRLFPIPVVMFLVSTLLLRGRAEAPLFWLLAVATSFVEPYTQDMGAQALGAAMLGAVLLRGFGLNFLQAVLFRKSGYLSAILMRVAFYGVWHILYLH